MSEVSKKYILNAIDVYMEQLKRRHNELYREIKEMYPTSNDSEPIPDIMDEIRAALPDKYSVTWKGKSWDCKNEKFKVTVEIAICTKAVEVYNEKSREAAYTRLDALYKRKQSELTDWNAAAWVALANKKEIPTFDTSMDIDLPSFGTRKV